MPAGRFGQMFGAKKRWRSAAKYGSPIGYSSWEMLNASKRSGGRSMPRL
jgi:hypothetical protein